MESSRKQSCQSMNSSEKKRKCGRTDRHRFKRKTERRFYREDSSEILINLCKWLKQKGMTKQSGSQLRAAFFPHIGRGLMAVNKIRQGEVVVSIPRQVLITCNDVLNREQVGCLIRLSGRKLKAMELLTLFVVHHKLLKESSPWEPYIDSLPGSYTVPIYCSELEYNLLPMFIKHFIEQQVDDVNKCYHNVKDILFESLGKVINIGTDDIRWGWFTVNTRAVYLKNDSPDSLLSDDDIYALAPYLDLLNHLPNAQVTAGLNKESKCYEIVTQKPFGQFQQVFINYGPHDNMKLYREYGFIVPNNPHDNIPVILDELKSIVKETFNETALSNEVYVKYKILKKNNLDERMSISREGPSWNLVVTMTILHMNAEELKRWQLVYHDLENVQHRLLIIRSLNKVIMYKYQQFLKYHAEMDIAVECTEAFVIARDLVRECIELLSAALKNN